jgi:hypothetical protein
MSEAWIRVWGEGGERGRRRWRWRGSARAVQAVAAVPYVELGLGFWGDLWSTTIEEVMGATMAVAVDGSGGAASMVGGRVGRAEKKGRRRNGSGGGRGDRG